MFQKSINEALESAWAMTLSPEVINQIHAVYDSYKQNSIKESEDTTPANVGLESVIPVDLKSL